MRYNQVITDDVSISIGEANRHMQTITVGGVPEVNDKRLRYCRPRFPTTASP